ncbi:dicarboxylate/amino acid:cation symporter [Burkholderia arboris]|uniref:cation:dicarboxylate symporter family transporter n=1 Tax=Burkholderia arboris TaxID=488730 RepID=UPI001CF11511|nr:cation:dicarboxylase symporter family transporter [Burkholderia arboris]MCA8036621.1 dicarboxylate/amino acid:cation symporter [Burkholderia arboris]
MRVRRVWPPSCGRFFARRTLDERHHPYPADTAALQPLGGLFIPSIRMCAGPVAFVSLACAIMSLSDLAARRRIAWKAIAIHAVPTAFAAGLAMAAATRLFSASACSCIGTSRFIAGHPCMPSFAIR